MMFFNHSQTPQKLNSTSNTSVFLLLHNYLAQSVSFESLHRTDQIFKQKNKNILHSLRLTRREHFTLEIILYIY